MVSDVPVSSTSDTELRLKSSPLRGAVHHWNIKSPNLYSNNGRGGGFMTILLPLPTPQQGGGRNSVAYAMFAHAITNSKLIIFLVI